MLPNALILSMYITEAFKNKIMHNEYEKMNWYKIYHPFFAKAIIAKISLHFEIASKKINRYHASKTYVKSNLH